MAVWLERFMMKNVHMKSYVENKFENIEGVIYKEMRKVTIQKLIAKPIYFRTKHVTIYHVP